MSVTDLSWHVYQLRSDTELLYVGYTRWPKERLACHRREKPWWPEVTDIQSEEFTNELEARLREKELWAAERPKYNRASPFRTPEERREEALTRNMTPEAREAKRERERARKRARPPVLSRAQMTPEAREAERERDRTPERRARKRAYKQTPEYKARQREYDRERDRTPEGRARKQTPEQRAYRRAYMREYKRRRSAATVKPWSQAQLF